MAVDFILSLRRRARRDFARKRTPIKPLTRNGTNFFGMNLTIMVSQFPVFFRLLKSCWSGESRHKRLFGRDKPWSNPNLTDRNDICWQTTKIRVNPCESAFICVPLSIGRICGTFFSHRGAESAEIFSFLRWLTIVHFGMLRRLFLSATDARGLNTDLWEQNTTKARIDFLLSQSRIMKERRILVFKITAIRDHPLYPRHPCSLFL